ncbi:epigen [Aulostomus maculatus]
MLAQRQTYLKMGISFLILLLLATSGQSAQTTTPPAVPDSSPTALLNDSSVEEPVVLRLHSSCRSEHENYCGNGGQCMYPQDSEKPSCICPPSFNGPRCLFVIEITGVVSEAPLAAEQLITIIFGVLIVLFILAVMGCCIFKRCKKSTQLKKSEPCEMSV